MNEFDRFCGAAVLEMVLALMPKDIASLRELRIQNQKLQRMLSRRDNDPLRSALVKLGGPTSIKKWQRAKEKRAQEISQQAKKVRILATTFFKDFLRQSNPRLSNAEFQTWKKTFEDATKKSAESFKAHVLQQLPRNATPKRTGFGLINRSN